MKSNRPPLFPGVMLAALLTLLSACASLPGQKADIDAVITASGLDAQLKQLQQPLAAEKMDGLLAMIPDEWIHMVNATIAQTLQPEQIRSSLRDTLEKKLSARELADVQKFYESNTGRRVVSLESGKADNTFINSTINDDATLDALAETTGAGKAVSLLAQHGLNDAVDIALKNGCFGLSSVPFSGMLAGVVKKAQLNALRQSVNTRVRQQYAQLSPDEQSTYLSFSQSLAGQKFFVARNGVMADAATRTGDALSGQLTVRIKELCAAKA